MQLLMRESVINCILFSSNLIVVSCLLRRKSTPFTKFFVEKFFVEAGVPFSIFWGGLRELEKIIIE